MIIPFVDLKSQYDSIQEHIKTALAEVISSSEFIGGHFVRKFETDFAGFLGVKHVVSCANGTDSLEILLKAYNVGIGDEVIVPAVSWISTSEAVSNVGATPVFVDIENDYYCIDITKIEEKISTKTKAIIPVHLYGQPADMPNIMRLSKKYNLIVIEDCAQAHNAKIENQIIGTWGHAASFSFYPGKNLGAYGDAGAMVTNDDFIAKKIRQIANHGQSTKHNHEIEGRNSRMDAIQAAVLSVKLNYLNDWTNKRVKNSELYCKYILSKNKVPKIRPSSNHVFHLFVVRVEKRDDVIKQLEKNNIQVSIHYPNALPFLECYKSYNHKVSDFPVSCEFVKQIVSLPMYPELTEEQIRYVSNKINNE